MSGSSDIDFDWWGSEHFACIQSARWHTFTGTLGHSPSGGLPVLYSSDAKYLSDVVTSIMLSRLVCHSLLYHRAKLRPQVIAVEPLLPEWVCRAFNIVPEHGKSP